MLSLEKATRVLEDAARELESMSYEDLGRLADAQRRDPTVLSRTDHCEGAEVYIDASLTKLRWLRRRVCVEMTLTGGPRAERGEVTPCIYYFERYASGRLYRPRDKGILLSMLQALTLVFVYVVLFVVVASAIVAAAWWIMRLRAG